MMLDEGWIPARKGGYPPTTLSEMETKIKSLVKSNAELLDIIEEYKILVDSYRDLFTLHFEKLEIFLETRSDREKVEVDSEI